MSISTLLNFSTFILAQNEQEKKLSLISMIVLGVMLLILVIDSTAWFRSDYVPRSKAYKAFLLLFFFVAMGAALILFRIYYK